MIRLEEHDTAPETGRLMELTEKIFSPSGWLVSTLGLEHRPQQFQMAQQVARHLEVDAPLLFEAGTGVGKSLAYLLPGIIHAIDRRRKLIVSTHTILLQDQILKKDLEICRALFKEIPELKAYREFRPALLVGRSNYVCPRRLKLSVGLQQELFSSTDMSDLDRLIQWAKESPEGRREELKPGVGGELWDAVNADSDTCTRSVCQKNECFFYRARMEFEAAHVAIVNHSLLLNLLQATDGPQAEKAPGILVPKGFAVLDEAHTIPEVATDQLGMAISAIGIERCLKRLFNPEKGKGLCTKLPNGSDACDHVVRCLGETDLFFDAVNEIMGANTRQTHQRLLRADWIDSSIVGAFTTALVSLGELAEKNKGKEAGKELGSYVRRLRTYRDGLAQFMNLPDLQNIVYWLERSIGRRRKPLVYLRFAPIDLAPTLRNLLFENETSCILTSATLSVGDEIRGFRRTVGAEDATAQVVDSPFDYTQQMEIWVAGDAPTVSGKQSERLTQNRVEYLAALIPYLSEHEGGGTLTLFTSYREMVSVAERIRQEGKLKRLLLVHEAGKSRSELIEAFKEAENALLFGVDSFWTGLDLPGRTLSQVIITKLPFRPFGLPVTEARIEAARARGENPFATITLPETLIRLRQGVGRLIRGHQDEGRIILLDPRFLSQNYGRTALGVLPRKDYKTFHGLQPKEIFS